jgi:hypothetical protein
MIKMFDVTADGKQAYHLFPFISHYRCGELNNNEKLVIVQYEDTHELYCIEDGMHGIQSLERYLRYRQIDGRIEIFDRPTSSTFRYFTSDCRTINV